MELKNFPAQRNSVKSTGKQVSLQTNMFKYSGTGVILHHYLVSFDPPVHRRISFDVFMRAMSQFGSEMPKIAFDGINMLVSKEKFNNKTFTLGNEKKQIRIDIQYKNTYDMADINKGVDLSQHIQCLEVVLRFNQRLRFIADGFRVFGNKADGELSSVLELRTGLTHTLKITKMGYFLNVDTAFAGFYASMPFLEFVGLVYAEQRGRDDRHPHKRRADIDLSRNDLGGDFYNKLEKMLRNVKVRTIHRKPKRELSFKVSEIQQQPASEVIFEVQGEKISVAEYFAKVYKPLKYPNLPLVVVKKAGMALHFPMEVLEIAPDQKYMKKLNEDQTATMIKYAAKPPINRFKIIREKVEELKVLQNEENSSFGLSFSGDFAKCEGVVLGAPQVKFSNQNISPMHGSWNLRDVRATKPVSIEEWMVIAFSGRMGEYEEKIEMFMRMADKYGVKFHKRPVMKMVRDLDEFYELKKPPFIMVILPNKDSQRYEKVKRICETYSSVTSQCILQKNAFKLDNGQFAGNLLLKINAKLGGINSTVNSLGVVFNQPSLVIGIDVNHPGIGDLNSPSIVAVVGSMNSSLTAFKTVVRQQERRQEIVEGLSEIVKDMLKAFFTATSHKPSQIIIFRDGVGDSQFQTVFHSEILAIKQACQSLDSKYNPKILFIVAQKRHSIRFNDPKSEPSRRGQGPTGNVVPGTVVEDIGHPTLFDFYLVSHQAIQGTARPVRYLILLNESNYSSKDIQEFIYSLCHLYARASKAVSVVPPIYYAHLAAARGKCYLERDEKSDELVMRKNAPGFSSKLFYV